MAVPCILFCSLSGSASYIRARPRPRPFLDSLASSSSHGVEFVTAPSFVRGSPAEVRPVRPPKFKRSTNSSIPFICDGFQSVPIHSPRRSSPAPPLLVLLALSARRLRHRWDRAVRVSVPVAFDVSIACSRAASRARRQKKRVTRRRGDKKTAAAIAMATSAVILGKRGATLPIGRGRRGTVPYHARTRREDGHAIIKRRRRRGDNGRPLDGCIMQQRKGTMFDVHDKPVEDLRERMRLLQSDRCVCPFFKRKQAAATSF